MYKTVLVEQMIVDGKRLLKALMKKQMPISAAVWFYDPEKSSWKLYIVTPVATQPGPLEAYMRMQPVVSELNGSFALDDIIVLSPTSTRFRQFQREIEGASGMTLLDPKGAPRDISFDDAYIYRW